MYTSLNKYIIFHHTRAENTTFAILSGERKWYFRPGYPIQKRDGLEIVTSNDCDWSMSNGDVQFNWPTIRRAKRALTLLVWYHYSMVKNKKCLSGFLFYWPWSVYYFSARRCRKASTSFRAAARTWRFQAGGHNSILRTSGGKNLDSPYLV